MRYNNSPIKKTLDGREVYRTSVLPSIPKSTLDVTIATETGDRLDTLATQFYGDPSLWWVIASANNIHTAPIGFKDGTILRIPVNYPRYVK
jgi:nucleoid-associated protein YgaU